MVHIQRNVALFKIFADTWDLHGSVAGQLDLRFFDFSVIILYSYTPQAAKSYPSDSLRVCDFQVRLNKISSGQRTSN